MIGTSQRDGLASALAANPDGILERIAVEHNVSTFVVVEALPQEHRTIASGDCFEHVMQAVTGWGEIVFVVHTPDIVLECKGTVPPGTTGRGYFNLHGDSPIGGHIRAENCRHIVFVDRPFMGRRSLSIQFFNAAGEAIFKIFVRRDERRALVAEQVSMFEALRSAH